MDVLFIDTPHERSEFATHICGLPIGALEQQRLEPALALPSEPLYWDCPSGMKTGLNPSPERQTDHTAERMGCIGQQFFGHPWA